MIGLHPAQCDAALSPHQKNDRYGGVMMWAAKSSRQVRPASRTQSGRGPGAV